VPGGLARQLEKYVEEGKKDEGKKDKKKGKKKDKDD
jgi:hypothetical protein